ncbi:hypothetical protein GCM10028856_35590 [Halopiger thermotolerans]
MPIRKLRNMDGSGGVTLPKDDLERDGLVNENGELKDARLAVDRVGDGEYRITAIELDNS